MFFEEKQSFKTVDERNIESLGKVWIFPALHTSPGKCTVRNIIALMVPDDDTSIRVGMASSAEIVLEN